MLAWLVAPTKYQTEQLKGGISSATVAKVQQRKRDLAGDTALTVREQRAHHAMPSWLAPSSLVESRNPTPGRVLPTFRVGPPPPT